MFNADEYDLPEGTKIEDVNEKFNNIAWTLIRENCEEIAAGSKYRADIMLASNKYQIAIFKRGGTIHIEIDAMHPF